MSEVLVRAVADVAAFLALSGDDVVRPDAAVGQLEQLPRTLRALDDGDRRKFLAVVARMRREETDPERAAFLGELGESFGLE